MYDVLPRVRPPPPDEEDYEPHIDPVTYEGEFFQETRRGVKHRLANRYTLAQNTEVLDDEDDYEMDDDEEEVEVEEVTNAADLSMLEQLQKGLPYVEPDEEVIYDDTRDTHDDDASNYPREETDDPDYE